jgi:hypothetical protein
MSNELDMLPPDVQALLRAEKDRVAAPDAGRARLAERLAVAVPAFGAPHVIPSAPPAAPPVVVATGGALKAFMAKAILGLALGGGVAATIESRTRAHPATTTHAEPARAREEAPRVAPPPAAREEVTPLAASAVPVAGPAPPSASSSLAATLREERHLIEAARDANVQGELETALDLTAKHAARFPHGTLAEERDAVRIRALARMGRKDEARALLSTMRQDYPHSFLLEGAAADVDAIP